MLKRNIIHITMVGFALLLAYLTKWGALACAVASFLFNLLVYPRIAKDTFKQDEVEKGYQPGVLMYSVSVFILILVFPMHVAAGAWAVMSLGDGFASLVGRRIGKTFLPWNANKTLEGSITFIIAATAGCLFFVNWVLMMGQGESFNAALIWICLVVGITAAVVESLPLRFEDNLTVPLFSGFVLWALFQVDFGRGIEMELLWGSLLSAGVALVAWKLKSVDKWGMISGFVVGVAVALGLGVKGFLVLLAFFAVGSISTKVGISRKQKMGVAEKKKGARGADSVLANGGVAVIFALLAGWAAGPAVGGAALAAYIAALAAAAADTVAGEIGQLLGRRPVLITTLREIPAGTDGGVTLAGLLAGVIAAALVAGSAYSMNMIDLKVFGIVVIAATAGNIMDSLFGAIFERRGSLGNTEVNLICTLTGALVAYAFVSGVL